MKKKLFPLLLLASLGVLFWFGTATTQVSSTCPEQITGAIYTTDKCGAKVNGNLYTSACVDEICSNGQVLSTAKKVKPLFSPWLNGGPRPHDTECKGQGLPDGVYYFMVTDPPGKNLLNVHCNNNNNCNNKEVEPIAARMFEVKNGKFFDNLGTHEDVPGSCPESVRIQLFDKDCYYHRKTTNNGGVYKVWITPKCRFEEAVAGRDDVGSEAWTLAGFVSRYCKTDVFKVKAPGPHPSELTAVIVGWKYYDTNANGEFNDGEVGIDNWLIKITPVNGAPAPISPDISCTTGGMYFFEVKRPNSGFYQYEISEMLPEGWVSTTKGDLPKIVTIYPNTEEVRGPDWDFFNVCLTNTNCKTKGFWHNKNGAPLVTPADLAALRDLCLVNSDGTPFMPTCSAFVNPQESDPCPGTNLSPWLVSSVEGNIAHQLSMQLAAFWLNAHHFNVQCGNDILDDSDLYESGPPCCPNTSIYAPGSQFADPKGFVSVEGIIGTAKTYLCANPNPTPGSQVHTEMAALTDFLTQANEDNFQRVNSQPCDFTPICPCAEPNCTFPTP